MNPHLRATVGLSLVAALAPVLLTATPSQAAAAPKARTDSVTVAAGTKTRVDVLTNDRVAAKGKATVRLTRIPAGLRAKVRGRTVKVVASRSTAPGVFRIRYNVTDTTARTTGANIKVTVTSSPVPPAAATGTLRALVAALPVAAEHTTGYDRDLFKHWNTGLNPTDGCDTRDEVLIAEAVTPPTVGTPCALTGGTWVSYYDGVTTIDSGTFDIDHLVPLADAWYSGAWNWTPARREAYANDQGDPRSLVAVTANSNRSKGDRDPGEWLPLMDRCRYASEWVATKYRWSLSADPAEKASLTDLATGCPEATIAYTPVP